MKNKLNKIFQIALLVICLLSLTFSIIALAKTSNGAKDYITIKHAVEEKIEADNIDTKMYGMTYEKIKIVDSKFASEEKGSKYYFVHFFSFDCKEYTALVRIDSNGNTKVWWA